jgi:hypothetical protein
MLADEITHDLRALRAQAVADAQAGSAPVVVALRSKGIRFGALTAFPDGSVDTAAVEGVNADLRVRPFFAQGATLSIREFLIGAFNAEMGLETCDPELAAAAAGAAIVTPSGMALDGSADTIETPPAVHVLDDPDGDGVADETPQSVVDFMEFYLLNYFKPAVRAASSEAFTAEALVADGEVVGLTSSVPGGRGLFERIGCAACHVPDLRIENDRRVADVETVLDVERGNPLNNLFSTAIPRFTAVDDGSGHPALKVPSGGEFTVRNFFADLKRHDLGPNFWEKNFDGTLQKEFMTEPLWGVASTSPYGHDGRSPTLEDVILRHGGEAQSARDAFAALNAKKKAEVLAFLGTLVLFSPPATASNLEPRNEAALDYPVDGHGSISLTVLFNDPLDKE